MRSPPSLLRLEETRPAATPRVTVLTGYLGAGKTTLVNHLLSTDHGYRIAVIVNEAGEIGIDGDLIVSSDEEVIEMANGCVCCTLSVRSDLTVTLKNLLSSPEPPDYVLIEASGVADPVPLTQALFVEDLADRLVPDGIVTIVDAKHIEQHLDEFRSWQGANRAVDQILGADRVILNKADLISEADGQRIEGRIRDLNTTAPILRSTFARVAPGQILGIGAFDPARRANESGFLEADAPTDTDISTASLEVAGALDRSKLVAWVEGLVKTRSEDLHRIKGILAFTGETQPMVLQGVRSIYDIYPGGSWNDRPGSRVVLIGRNLDQDELRRGFMECRA